MSSRHRPLYTPLGPPAVCAARKGPVSKHATLVGDLRGGLLVDTVTGGM